jgi:hypothetical protein
MADPVQVLPADALANLSKVLGVYASYRRIPAVRALDRQGRNLSIKLTQEFMRVTPADARITNTARARGWRVGRDYPAESGPENTGLSEHTLRRTRALMGSFRSILARVTLVDGRVKVTPVALGRSMNKRTGLRRRVQYRPGRNFTVSGRADQRFTLKGPDDKVLNFRALATVTEMNLRESGRRFLAISWMYRRWRILAPKDRDRTVEPAKRAFRRLETRNPRSKISLQGEVVLTEGAPGPQAQDSLRLTSFVPGVETVGKSRGLFRRALDGVAEDMASWMATKEAERLAANIAKAVSK